MAGTKMVRKQIDTVDALMAHYVAGSLPEPARVLVATHLEMKPDNRSLVSDLHCLAGQALELTEPVPVGERDRRLEAIFSSASAADDVVAMLPQPDGSLPRALREFIGYDLQGVPWRTRLPGFREYSMGKIDGCEVSLMWIRAGRALPAHSHRGVELTLVVDGAFTDIRGRFGPGDISVADDSLEHRPMAEKGRPCIAFSVLEAPIRLTGSLTQLIGDLIG